MYQYQYNRPMTSTKAQILRSILHFGEVSVTDLAHTVNVTPMAVRHHLASLQAQGLIEQVTEAPPDDGSRRVGRPKHLYKLTQRGQERFPSKYLELSQRLIEQMKSTMPSDIIEDMFRRMARERASQIEDVIEDHTLEEKLRVLVELLGEDGFNAEWKRLGGEYLVTERSCPYFVIGQSHPEVCNYDQTLISRVLDVPVQKRECMLHGSKRCTFVIQPNGAS